MPLLTDFDWRIKYDPDEGTLIEQFYLTALACAQRYDRTTGYFSATALAIAARGVEGLVLNAGRMRMVVGCTLGESEVKAIEQGQSLKDTVAGMLLSMPLVGRTRENRKHSNCWPGWWQRGTSKSRSPFLVTKTGTP